MPTPIIVVHDDPDTRGSATNALRDAGYEVTAFDNPMSVLDALDIPTHLRLLITRVDFGPGKLNGAALARMVRQKQPTAEVVFVALDQNRRYTTELGEFLPAPLDPAALVDVVGRLLVEPAEAGSA